MDAQSAGARAALMDEYRRAATELAGRIGGLDHARYTHAFDPEAVDPDCRSIQTVFSHVLRSGFGYADYLRLGPAAAAQAPELFSQEEGLRRLPEMIAATGAALAPIQDLAALRIQSRHGPVYDGEQLLEHAIVHVLRHRRQIDRWLAPGPTD